MSTGQHIPPNLLDAEGNHIYIVSEFLLDVSLACALMASSDDSPAPKVPLFVPLEGTQHRELNPAIGERPILELDCYTKGTDIGNLYDKVNKLRQLSKEQQITNSYISPTMMMLGHPGIGKTSFLIYTFLRQIQENKAVLIVFSNTQAVLFVPSLTEGATSPRDGHLRPFIANASAWRALPPTTLILLDSNPEFVGPHGIEAANRRPLIQASSSTPDCLRWLQKNSRLPHIQYIATPLPTDADLSAFGKILERLYARYNPLIPTLVGPCLRRIAECVVRQLTEKAIVEDLEKLALNMIDVNHFPFYNSALRGTPISNVQLRRGFQKIFFATPTLGLGLGEVTESTCLTYYLPTPSINSAFGKALAAHWQDLLKMQWDRFENSSFFAYAYEYFAKFKLQAISRQYSGSSVQNIINLYSEHLPVTQPSRTAKKLKTCHVFESTPAKLESVLSIPKATRVIHNFTAANAEQTDLQPSETYYIHTDTWFFTANSIIIGKNICILFRITTKNGFEYRQPTEGFNILQRKLSKTHDIQNWVLVYVCEDARRAEELANVEHFVPDGVQIGWMHLPHVNESLKDLMAEVEAHGEHAVEPCVEQDLSRNVNTTA